MTRSLTRRSFLKTSVAAGASIGVGGGLLGGLVGPRAASAEGAPDLAVMTSASAFDNTVAAVNRLGGIGRFISEGASVVINANTAFKHPGSIVDPAVTIAVVALCLEAGAAQVKLLKPVPEQYWERSGFADAHARTIASAKVSERTFKEIKIPNGKALQSAQVDPEYLSADVCLNVAVAKDHRGSGFSGALKNAMGASPHDPTCRFCHFGDKTDGGWYDNMDHLSQCIADLNLVRKPDLCILDATEYLTSNGPFGPGDLRRSDTVVAGIDPVAIDAYGARFLEIDPAKISMIELASRHGIGQADLSKIRIEEASPA